MGHITGLEDRIVTALQLGPRSPWVLEIVCRADRSRLRRALAALLARGRVTATGASHARRYTLREE